MLIRDEAKRLLQLLDERANQPQHPMTKWTTGFLMGFECRELLEAIANGIFIEEKKYEWSPKTEEILNWPPDRSGDSPSNSDPTAPGTIRNVRSRILTGGTEGPAAAEESSG